MEVYMEEKPVNNKAIIPNIFLICYSIVKEECFLMKHNKKDIKKESNFTYDDYASINDGNRYELVKGQLELMSPSPSTIHQLILSELDFLISLTCKTDYFILFAPIDLILSKNEVRQPDLILISRQRIDILTKRGVEGSPDLVVEILSPNSLKRDRIDKLKTYEQYEIPEYWIIDPTHQTLEQYHLVEGKYETLNVFQNDESVKSPTIKCISFTMKQLMGNLPKLKD